MQNHRTGYFVAFKKYVKDLRPIPGTSLAVGTCPVHNKNIKKHKDDQRQPLIMNYRTGQWLCFMSGHCGAHEVFRHLCTKHGNRRYIELRTYEPKSDEHIKKLDKKQNKKPREKKRAAMNDIDISKW